MGLFAKLFSFIGNLGSSADVACYFWFYDEPECPKSIIEK